ncbi:MAG: hypothetical protein ACT6FC_06395, partial [Methanosarcinaceae archaeon]
YLREQLSDIKTQIMIVEQDIIAQTPGQKLEGTTPTAWGSITNKLNRKLDYDNYMNNVESLPVECQFVDLKPTINLKRLRIAELVNHSFVDSCITIKPARPTINIKEVAE